MKRWDHFFIFAAGIIPLGVASVLSVFLLCGIHLFHESSYYYLPAINITYIFLAAIYFVLVVIIVIGIMKIKHTTLGIIAVFSIAILPRIILIILFGRQIIPFSDFLWSWDVAQGAREGFSYTVHLPFPAYQIWAYFEFLITKIFPNNYVTILIINAVFDSLIAISIIRIMLLITNNRDSSKCAGVLYALFPSAIIYCTTSTPEIIVILLNIVGIIFLIKSHIIINNHDGKKYEKKYSYIIASGIIFGISSSFKPFSIVIIVAFFIVELLHSILYKNESMIELFINVLILLASYFAIKRIILFVVSQWLGIDLSQYTSGVLYHQLLVGLNTEGEGQIHLGTISRGFMNTFLQNGYDSAAAGEYAKQLLVENWSNHIADVPLLLEKKIVWAWQDDLIPIHYFLNLMGVDG